MLTKEWNFRVDLPSLQEDITDFFKKYRKQLKGKIKLPKTSRQFLVACLIGILRHASRYKINLTVEINKEMERLNNEVRGNRTKTSK